MRQESVLNYLYEKAAESSEALLSTTSVAKELLTVTLNSCKDVYIVLDGLDEYSRAERKDLTSWFIDLISSLSRTDFGSIRCLFISQEDGFARKDLSMLSQIKITPNDNKADIEAFCQHWHEEIEEKFGCLDGEQHVKNVISARAQGIVSFVPKDQTSCSSIIGMFLYAKLVTWSLWNQPSRAHFEAEMGPERLPEDLDQA